MLDDLLADLFGEALYRSFGDSRRLKAVFRIGFGLLGAGLGLFGAGWMLLSGEVEGGWHLRLAMASMFVFMGAFWLCNAALLRRWGWPWKGFALSFAGLFVLRILLGP